MQETHPHPQHTRPICYQVTVIIVTVYHRIARRTNRALSKRQRYAATSASPKTATHPLIYRAEAIQCRVVIVTAPVTKRDQANCALSNNERHHDCQNAPTLYIQHKTPMYKNVMLSNVASSLSQRPSRSATKQTAPSRTTSGTTTARTLPHNTYSPAHAIGELPRAYDHRSSCQDIEYV